MAALPLITDSGPAIVEAIYIGSAVVAGAVVVGAVVLATAVGSAGRHVRALRRQVERLRDDLADAQGDAAQWPLNAEQIVRGVGYLAAQSLDRSRRPGDDAIGFPRMTLALGRAMGVPLPTGPWRDAETGKPFGDAYGLAPYGAEIIGEER